MKNALLIFGGLALVAGGSWAIWRFVVVPKQKFSFTKIDWLNKTVTYSEPTGSGTVSYTALKNSGGEQDKINGSWNVSIKPGNDLITFTLKKGTTILDMQMVDFKNQKVIALA